MNEREMQDYIMHYGVKGMRWGHRKDGKKTLSKRKQKKASEFKKSTIDRTKRAISSEKSDAKRVKENLKRIRQEGPNSKRIKDLENSFDDKEYLELIGGRKGIWDEEVSRLKRDYENAIDRGKAYAQALLALESTDPSKHTAKEMAKTYRDAWNKSLNESVKSSKKR